MRITTISLVMIIGILVLCVSQGESRIFMIPNQWLMEPVETKLAPNHPLEKVPKPETRKPHSLSFPKGNDFLQDDWSTFKQY